jgi:hypothetical protein
MIFRSVTSSSVSHAIINKVLISSQTCHSIFILSSLLSLNGLYFLQTYAAKSPGSGQKQPNGKKERDVIGRTPVRYLLARIMKVCGIV